MRIEQQPDEQLSPLDELIEKARELGQEVKERATELARNVADRLESFFGQGWEAVPAEGREEARPPTRLIEELVEQRVSAVNRQMALQEAMDVRVAAFNQRVETEVHARHEKEQSQERDVLPHQYGFEIER